MAKDKFMVIFTLDNVRIQYGTVCSITSHDQEIVYNPDLSAVHGIPPHMWKLVDGKIVSNVPVEPITPAVVSQAMAPSFTKKQKVLMGLLAMIVVTILYLLIRH